MDACPLIRQHHLRWALQAVVLGSLAGFGIHLTGMAGVTGALRSMEVGIILTGVIWGGFDLVDAPLERFPKAWRPEWIGLAAVAWILVWFTLLIAVAVTLVRLLLGVNLAGDRHMMIASVLIGLAISGFMATRETVARKVALDRQLAKAEARAAFLSLQAQLSPHTLFNALNTIASLIPEEPARAEEATVRLAALLRRILGALEQPEWALREEFSLLEDLLRLEELRFGDRLRFELALAPAMADQPIQPLLLLPLVENALKHGFRPKVGPCTLRVTARDGAVRIEDDGVGRLGSAPEGLGLRTVRERLAACGGSLRWVDAGVGCAVEVRLG